MHDHDALRTYEALLKDVKAKLTNFPSPQHKFDGISKNLYVEQSEFLTKIAEDYSYEEIQACLKVLEKSVKFWNKQSDSQGYLSFISKFM